MKEESALAAYFLYGAKAPGVWWHGAYPSAKADGNEVKKNYLILQLPLASANEIVFLRCGFDFELPLALANGSGTYKKYRL